MLQPKNPQPKKLKNIPSPGNLSTGKYGEQLATAYLAKKGFEILNRNIRTPFGEIDILCKRGKTYHFVEVKTRRSDKYGKPVEAVGLQKQKRIHRSILYIQKLFRIEEQPVSFDVLSIEIDTQRPIAIFKLYDTLDIT